MRQNNSNIYNVLFKKEIKKSTCRYHYQNLDDIIYMIYSSSDIEQNILKLVILAHLLLFYPHKNPKIKILKNEKISWDIIILHMCTKYFNHMMYGSWDTEWNRQNFCHFGPFFALSAPWQPLNQNFKIEKKTFRDIIMIHICIRNDNHMMFGSWDMERHWQNFLSFWTSFCPFIPLWTQKIQILKKWTIYLKKLLFYKCVP